MPTADAPSPREWSGRRPAAVRAPSLPLGLPRRRMCCGKPWRGGPTAESTFVIRRLPVLTLWPRLVRSPLRSAEFGAFDLVLVGRNSLDGDTGQVGPEIAELSGLPFARGVREMGLSGETLTLTLEQDDGWEDVWSNCRPSSRSRSACASPARCLRTDGPKWRMTRSAGSGHQSWATDHGGRLAARPSSAALGRSTTTEQERSSPEIWRPGRRGS